MLIDLIILANNGVKNHPLELNNQVAKTEIQTIRLEEVKVNHVNLTQN